MSWNANWPLSTTKLKKFPGSQRDNNDVIEETLAVGHTYPGTYGDDAGKHPSGVDFYDSLIFQDTGEDGLNRYFKFVMEDDYISIYGTNHSGEYTLLAKFERTSAFPTIDYVKATQGWYALPSNTRMIFGMSSAPGGWTFQTDEDDSLLRVVSGAVGVGSGDWDIESNLTVVNHSHTHSYSSTTSGPSVSNNAAATVTICATPDTHTHTLSGELAADEHNHTVELDSDWRPAYYDVREGAKN